MLEWKTSEEAKTVHKELYDLIDPNDPRSDTLLTVIIKAVFSDKELTNENARWAQLVVETITRRMKKNLQKSAILFGTKSNAYLQINRPIFAYSWLFLPILAYLRICSKSPRIYFAFRAEYPCLFLPIFRHLTCVRE